jgi:glycosyltransferase involved in cell wall biosynthesis
MESTPLISIVTPCFNAARFLDAAMRSVLAQDWPAIEYAVADGGSTDGSVEIIRQHENLLAWWTSGRDGGQYAALNTAFARTRGEIMGWLNADDQYTPWALSVVGEIFATFPEVEWLTTRFPLRWDERGRAVRCVRRSGYSRAAFLAGENLPAGAWRHEGWIQQESTFWRRSLWERAGATLDTRWKLAADFDLWARFFQHAELVAVETPLGGFRLHADQKTSQAKTAYHEEALSILRAHGGKPVSSWRGTLRSLAQQLPKSVRGAGAAAGLLRRTRLCELGRGATGWRLVSALH